MCGVIVTHLKLSHFLWILLLCPLAHLQTDESRSTKDGVLIMGDGEELLPFFDPASNMTTNLTVQMGSEVFLSCPVQHLGPFKVSWVKKDSAGNMQLLTYGTTTYRSDGRESSNFVKPNDWQLRLSSVQRSDGGIYQCQISTHPPRILQYTLNVIAPTVEIVDDGEKPLKDKIFKIGSTLELRCIVNQIGPTIDSQHVSWYHGTRLLNNDTFRGGISVKSWVQKEAGLSKLSKLYVANVNQNDSGWYTCSMGRFGNATVYVSIYIQGETPAAMQHGAASPTFSSSSFLLLLLISLRCCIQI